ncbi:MAG: hypothetical protein Q8M29_05820 [Bacteroidota bacterium]|nr:hypothetical protein [Bacteroidota bacterium]
MKKTILLFFAILLTGAISQAQDLDVKWADKMMYDNKMEGFFNHFIDANSKYIYAQYTNLALRPKKAERKMKIVAYDKTTMKKVADVPLRGFRENQASVKKYEGLSYYKTLVFENVIYIFWRKEGKKKEELYVESFDSKLKSIAKIKKIYELPNPDSKKARARQSLVVMGNTKAGEKVLIGGEMPTEKDQNVKFEYKLMNSDLSFANASQIELPIKLTNKSYGLTSSYEYGDDGKLYIKSTVSMDKEERKKAAKGEMTSYTIFSVVDLTSGSITPFTFKFDNKNIFNLGFTVTDKGVKVYGFFCDLVKDPRGTDMHGIFYSILDSKNMTMTATNFSFFDKATLDKLFARDKEDQKSGGKGKGKKSKGKKSDEESLDSRYEIESAQISENDNLVLFCSKMYNWSVTTCNDKGGCVTSYYCQRDNITAFKVNKEGNIVWASNLDRKIIYNRWYVFDVRVVAKNNKYYVIYGSSYDTDATKKNRKSRKSKAEVRDKFEYGVFEDSNGNYKKGEVVINSPGTEKKERKFVVPEKISVIDNNFYVNSERIKFKPLGTTLYCVGSSICPLLLWPMMSDGNIRRGVGNLGKITPLK